MCVCARESACVGVAVCARWRDREGERVKGREVGGGGGESVCVSGCALRFVKTFFVGTFSPVILGKTCYDVKLYMCVFTYYYVKLLCIYYIVFSFYYVCIASKQTSNFP